MGGIFPFRLIDRCIDHLIALSIRRHDRDTLKCIARGEHRQEPIRMQQQRGSISERDHAQVRNSSSPTASRCRIRRCKIRRPTSQPMRPSDPQPPNSAHTTSMTTQRTAFVPISCRPRRPSPSMTNGNAAPSLSAASLVRQKRTRSRSPAAEPAHPTPAPDPWAQARHPATLRHRAARQTATWRPGKERDRENHGAEGEPQREPPVRVAGTYFELEPARKQGEDEHRDFRGAFNNCRMPLRIHGSSLRFTRARGNSRRPDTTSRY